jgi:hypothetical protein
MENLSIGDTLYFHGPSEVYDGYGGVGHTGIYIGDGKMIHASSSKGVVETSLDSEYWKSHFIAAGDLSAAGAEAGAGDGGVSGVSGSSEQKTVGEVMGARQSAYDKMMGEIGGFAGLKDKELLNDKIATGQYILDGVSALSANGNYLSIRGARDAFRLHSGVKDKDLFGVGLKGAFSGDGKMLADAGVLDMAKKLSKQAGETERRTYHLKGFEETEKYNSEMEKIAGEMHDAHKAQLETYEKEKEEKEKAIEKMDKSKQTAKISITVIGNDGKEKKLRVTEEELHALIARQEKRISNLEAELAARS